MVFFVIFIICAMEITVEMWSWCFAEIVSCILVSVLAFGRLFSTSTLFVQPPQIFALSKVCDSESRGTYWHFVLIKLSKDAWQPFLIRHTSIRGVVDAGILRINCE